MKTPAFVLSFLTIFAAALLCPADAADDRPRMPYRTFLVTRSVADEQLFPFLEAARPEIVQIGYYGAMFHGYADDKKSMGTPMNLPFPGEREVLDYQRDLNARIHKMGLKVVGHFGLGKAYGIWETKTGFVDWYLNKWPEDILGPKPHPDVREVLQRKADGTPIQTSRYEQAQVAFCLSSPHARQMFKQMLKVAVDHGADGVITNYNYHFECACPHCQESFRAWLGKNMKAGELKSKLGIETLATHRFESIPAQISGYPDPATATPLHWAAMRWAAENFQANFSEIFVDYGRTLKPDLIVAQWNHLSHVSTGNERMFLPIDRWGKGEDYFWESGGAAFVGDNLNLAEGKAGDAWLSCLTVRELNGGKPFVMGKYDGMRLAESTAEGFATGGLGMGRYMAFEDPAGFQVLVKYAQFMHRNRALYDGATPVAEVGLILPRQTAWAGNPEPWNDFRATGQALANDQILFDVIADENIAPERLKRYPAVLLPAGTDLSDSQKAALDAFKASGGKVIPSTEAAQIVSATKGTSIEAPWTVRASLFEQENRCLLHLVNYDRDEVGTTKADKAKKPENERPRAVKDIAVDLKLPADRKVTALKMHSPESATPLEIPFEQSAGRVKFRVPEVLVYGVVELTY
jgi:hypothetical protein